MVDKPMDMDNSTILVDHLCCLMVNWTTIFIDLVMSLQSFRPNCFTGQPTQNMINSFMSFTWSPRPNCFPGLSTQSGRFDLFSGLQLKVYFQLVREQYLGAHSSPSNISKFILFRLFPNLIYTILEFYLFGLTQS